MSRTLLFIICVLFGLSSAAAAQPPGLTPEQAAQEAKARHGGRVLNVRPLPNGDGGRSGYRVKLLDKGEVRTVTVPSKGKGKSNPKKDKRRARPDR